VTTLGIRNFKRFASIELAIRPMTVLTGLNGTGKSTAIQAMLLARQVAESSDSRVVQLNGPYGLALGEALDVLHPEAEQQEIEIRIDAAGAMMGNPF
jgi:predicted ATPase